MRKLLLLILFVLMVIGCIFFMRYRENVRYEEQGQKLINKIDSFQYVNKKLPNSLTDLGETESMGVGPFYEKIDENKYRVYFCIGFDAYKIYNSGTKEWTTSTQ